MPSIFQFCQLINDDWQSVLQSMLPSTKRRESPLLGNGTGANVVLCSDQGFKVSMHEIVVKRCTNILDDLDLSSSEELRDPFGRLVIVLQGVRRETLKALSQLLYTGECQIDSEESQRDLTDVLAPSVITALMSEKSSKVVAQKILPTTTTAFPLNQSVEGSSVKPQDQDEVSVDENVWCNLIGDLNQSPQPSTSKQAEETDENDEQDVNNVAGDNLTDITEEEGDDAEMNVNDRKRDSKCTRKTRPPTKRITGEEERKEISAKDVRINPSKSHLKLKTNKKKAGENPCKVCGKVFEFPSHLKIHQRIHTGEKPFQCTQCEKKFTQQHAMKVHERTHTGERPYPCSFCEKRFITSSNARGHERTHRKK